MIEHIFGYVFTEHMFCVILLSQTKVGGDIVKNYICIDLKSFYASVECRERNLDPLTTNLVVADESRTDKTICLAVTPALKGRGVPAVHGSSR